MKTTNCENCSKEFSYRYKGKKRRFCSTDCAYPNKSVKEYEALCPICGDLFLKVESNNKNKRKLTCGKQKCQKSRANHPNYSHKIEIKCDGCGKIFLKTSASFNKHTANGYKNHYCTSNCRSDHISEINRIKALEKSKLDPDELLKCKKCNQELKRIEFRKLGRNTCKNCFGAYQQQRWTNRKIWAIKYLGGCCKDCGEIKHWVAYDFHHRDPSVKEFDWSKLRLRSKDDIIKELDKCDLLCSCCHRIRHFNERNLLK
jgi:hypothetical protein